MYASLSSPFYDTLSNFLLLRFVGTGVHDRTLRLCSSRSVGTVQLLPKLVRGYRVHDTRTCRAVPFLHTLADHNAISRSHLGRVSPLHIVHSSVTSFLLASWTTHLTVHDSQLVAFPAPGLLHIRRSIWLKRHRQSKTPIAAHRFNLARHLPPTPVPVYRSNPTRHRPPTPISVYRVNHTVQGLHT